jgi:hypothetical protein
MRGGNTKVKCFGFWEAWFGRICFRGLCSKALIENLLYLIKKKNRELVVSFLSGTKYDDSYLHIKAAKSYHEKECRGGRLRPRQHNPEDVMLSYSYLIIIDPFWRRQFFAPIRPNVTR